MALPKRSYYPNSLVSLIMIILVIHSINSQSTLKNSANQCQSVDQSECCRINIDMLQDIARRSNSARPMSSSRSGSKDMQRLLELANKIDGLAQILTQNSSTGVERCDETFAKSAYELVHNFLTYESGKNSSFPNLAAKISNIERNLQNLSQIEEEISSQMNGSINQSTNLIVKIFQDLMAGQTWNITSLVTLESGRNKRQLLDSMRVLFDTSNERLSRQEENIENITRSLGQIISKHGNKSQPDTNSCSKVEVILNDRADNIQAILTRISQHLTDTLQTKSITMERMMQQIINQTKNASNATNIQSAILSKLDEGQLREERKFTELADILEQLASNVTRPIIQKSTEIKQELERFQQQQNSTSHLQFDNLSTSLQQLRQLQQAEQQREQQREQMQQLQRYNNLTRHLGDLQASQTAQQSEQLRMKQLLDQLKQQLVSNNQQAEEMLLNERTMKQLLQDIKQQQQPSFDRTPDECPSGFIHFSNSPGCYAVVEQALTYDDAYRRCTVLYRTGRLATVETWQEHRYIQEYLRVNAESRNWLDSKSCGGTFWIGLERSPRTCASQFYWKKRNGASTFKEVDYNAFAPMEPNCASNNEHCAAYNSAMWYQWNDITCGARVCALCEAPTA